MIAVRPAVPADAAAMSAVLVASITELCVADHDNDPKALAAWLANKSPEAMAQWFANPDNRLFVAERDGEIAAVGGYNGARRIILNYVAPRHRRSGVSRALMEALEAELGPGEITLDSTVTARDFYRALGWEDAGPPTACGLVPGYPMRKVLAGPGV